MGSATLTETEVIMRYPKSIIEWEMKHGIVRYEKNGMLYIRGQMPEDIIFESIRREREKLNNLSRIGSENNV